MGEGREMGEAMHVGEIKKDSLTGGRHAGPCRSWVRSLIITDAMGSCGMASAKWGTQHDMHFENTHLATMFGRQVKGMECS